MQYYLLFIIALFLCFTLYFLLFVIEHRTKTRFDKSVQDIVIPTKKYHVFFDQQLIRF